MVGLYVAPRVPLAQSPLYTLLTVPRWPAEICPVYSYECPAWPDQALPVHAL